jgi:phage major head subunit gpT-like protein
MLSKLFHKTIGVLVMVLALIAMSAVPAFAGQNVQSPGWMFGLGGALTFGMVVNIGNLQALFTAFKTVFNKAFADTAPTYLDVSMEIPSTTAIEVHAWLGAFPKMRKWVGDRVISNLKSFKWQIENLDWESTVKVPRNSIDDDQFGIFTPIMSSMGASAKSHPDEVVYPLLTNGFTDLCYDGKAFFATNHDFGSNHGTSALSATSYGVALALIRRIKDDQGKPLFTGAEKLTLVVPPELESTGKKIVQNDFISVSGGSQENNIYKGTAALRMSPQLTSAIAWFITVEYNGIKPLIFQRRKAPEFQALTQPNDENVFMRKEFLYGTDSRDNAGYGLAQLAYGSTGAA